MDVAQFLEALLSIIGWLSPDIPSHDRDEDEEEGDEDEVEEEEDEHLPPSPRPSSSHSTQTELFSVRLAVAYRLSQSMNPPTGQKKRRTRFFF